MKKTLFIFIIIIAALSILNLKCTTEYKLLVANKNTTSIATLQFQSSSCQATPDGSDNLLSSNLDTNERVEISEFSDYEGIYCCIYDGSNNLLGSKYLNGGQDYVLLYDENGVFKKSDLSLLYE